MDNFEKDPSLIWQYFGSAKGFFRQYPGECVSNYLASLKSKERIHSHFKSLKVGFWRMTGGSRDRRKERWVIKKDKVRECEKCMDKNYIFRWSGIKKNGPSIATESNVK